MLKPDLSQWIGRSETAHGGISAEIAEMLHATVGASDMSAPRPGDDAPALWHWAAFTPKAGLSELGADGHPDRGGLMPPVGHPRRMWAGGDVSFHHPITIGEPLRQVTKIMKVEEKSETLTLVTLWREVYQDDWLVLSEQQDIVYLPIPDRFTAPQARPVPTISAFEVDVDVSQALLFRYSAATFNAHRIHYDLPYAQQVEKYPDLVVHGPLQATLMMGAAAAETGRRPSSFRYRGVHPMFASDPMRIYGYGASANSVSVCTGVPGAHQGMQADITWKAKR